MATNFSMTAQTEILSSEALDFLKHIFFLKSFDFVLFVKILEGCLISKWIW